MDKQKFLIPIAISIAIIAIDQWVKYYIKTHFYLGEEVKVFGDWCKIHFTENYGMAYGMEFGGKTGKNILTFFRIIAVSGIGYYIYTLIKKSSHSLYVISWTMIFAGALGNIVDSVLYGVLFGYDVWFHGRVVDMFYFPIIHTPIPDWFPIWKGEDFEFFRPVFNVADAFISIGFVLILIFQKKFFSEEFPEEKVKTIEEIKPEELSNN